MRYDYIEFFPSSSYSINWKTRNIYIYCSHQIECVFVISKRKKGAYVCCYVLKKNVASYENE